MDIFDLLPKDVFAKYIKRVWVMLPDGVLMITLAGLTAKFEQRTLEAIFLQVLNDPSRGNTIQEPENVGHLAVGVNQSVDVIQHNNVGQYQNAMILSSFVIGITEHLF